MELIKLTQDHYIIVDDSKINNGDVHFDFDKNEIDIWEGNLHSNRFKCKKITHSTQPLNKSLFFTDRVWGCERLSLGEVKELIGEVDVEKKAEKFIGCEYEDIEDNIDQIGYDSFIRAYNQAIEDNKVKKYTEEDMRKAMSLARKGAYDMTFDSFDNIIQSLQPKTEWEVEFIDGKLTLKK